ncbi:putative patatin/cPLA2 family phospholipase [Anaerosolibacter carboniphilus]|uniref:Putative patatin/cPLA2 family phospholipase n=1 Tax=Anaerosolibacter carboniphilus TaxID=1417629 RepID=A0A841KUI4_9FIRM|nr:patatin family protein [Anaerosolibacter carboniphilus]MBB6217296.1 putative patatin/cPLA2 family phospholipase [Anaerosolibacter carboniphilus]
MDKETVFDNRGYNALVVEGGAMRGIFSTGVLDAFLENGFNPFDICIGVSAGATNIASYLAEMYQRNYKVYTDYSIRPDFINWIKFMKGGHLVDLDWLWDATIREIRLDLERIFSTKKQFFVGVTEVKTGKAVYLKPDKNNLEEIMKASSSIPVFYRNFLRINNIDFADGGLADPIPVMEAYKRNAKNIMVIRSRPYDYTMKSNSNNFLSK